MNVTFSLPRVFRVALALIFIVLGYNHIVQFLPQDTLDLPARYFIGFVGTYEYSQLLLVILEILCGVFLLINIAVPLCLILMLPIITNLVAFHLESTQNLHTICMLAFIYIVYTIITIKKFSFLLEGTKE